VCFVCLVGSLEDELRLRLRLSSVPGHARPSSGGAFALRLVVIGQDFGLGWGARHILSTTSGEGDRLRHQAVAMGVANTSNSPVSFAAHGYGEGLERYSNYAPTTALSQWQLRQ
jgi:hypothetical protein